MGNTIKRTTTAMTIEWLIDTSACKKGTINKIHRHAYLSGWTDGNYFIPTSFIKNENLCRILEQK